MLAAEYILLGSFAMNVGPIHLWYGVVLAVLVDDFALMVPVAFGRVQQVETAACDLSHAVVVLLPWALWSIFVVCPTLIVANGSPHRVSESGLRMKRNGVSLHFHMRSQACLSVVPYLVLLGVANSVQ